MAEAGSWASIQRHGLLSTSALLNLFGYNGQRREAIESRHRTMSIKVDHAVHGDATIRDQKPLNEVKLANCLTDELSPQDWYIILNTRVFF
jgi:hypothetical protein